MVLYLTVDAGRPLLLKHVIRSCMQCALLHCGCTRALLCHFDEAAAGHGHTHLPDSCLVRILPLLSALLNVALVQAECMELVH